MYCEGECDARLHRRCAGLSKSLFNVLEKSSDPFYFPNCQLKKYAREIKELKSIINSLSENLSSLHSKVKPSEQPIHESMLTNATIKPPPNDPTHHQHPQAKPTSQGLTSSVDNKKFNTVLYGIKECPPKTVKPIHLEQDLQNIVSTFDKAALPVNNYSVKDVFRLRKYKPDAQRPRPILVKFLRSADASLALSKGSSFKGPIHIKPNLTPEERKIEKYLLKERWSLI